MFVCKLNKFIKKRLLNNFPKYNFGRDTFCDTCGVYIRKFAIHIFVDLARNRNYVSDELEYFQSNEIGDNFLFRRTVYDFSENNYFK